MNVEGAWRQGITGKGKLNEILFSCFNQHLMKFFHVKSKILMICFLFKGVAVTILDDGIEKDHPDLIRNYDPLASEKYVIYNL